MGPASQQADRAAAANAEEDRILRVWTPRLLRVVLAVAMLLLASGMLLVVLQSPAQYVQRYHQVRAGHLHERQSPAALAQAMRAGDPHAVLTLGLFVLSLVPLGRVSFCFLLFLRERDLTYVLLTAYVLLGLALGMWLGHAG